MSNNKEDLKFLLDVFKRVDAVPCGCSLSEIVSGHKTDCSFGADLIIDIKQAIAKLEWLLK